MIANIVKNYVFASGDSVIRHTLRNLVKIICLKRRHIIGIFRGIDYGNIADLKQVIEIVISYVELLGGLDYKGFELFEKLKKVFLFLIN